MNVSDKKVTIIGDTSQFHLGSKVNYTQFIKLVEKKYEIVQHIPYGAFGTDYLNFTTFKKKLKESRWWK